MTEEKVSKKITYELGSASFNRTLVLEIAQEQIYSLWCDVCKKDVTDFPVISTDSSDGEYGSVNFCEPCILEKLQEFKASLNQ